MVNTAFFASAALALSALVVAAPAATEDVTSLAKRTTGPSTANTASLQKTILDYHNAHRAYHQAGELTWDSKLASYAQNWVNKCEFAHSGGPYGENLYAIMPGPTGDWNEATIDGLNAWVYEVEQYSYSSPGFTDGTGHFTQYVWKTSTKVGCAWNTVACDGQALLMCEYNPPGNVEGQYTTNVLPPKSY